LLENRIRGKLDIERLANLRGHMCGKLRMDAELNERGINTNLVGRQCQGVSENAPDYVLAVRLRLSQSASRLIMHLGCTPHTARMGLWNQITFLDVFADSDL
jgi:hypothetical protein